MVAELVCLSESSVAEELYAERNGNSGSVSERRPIASLNGSVVERRNSILDACRRCRAARGSQLRIRFVFAIAPTRPGKSVSPLRGYVSDQLVASH
jgi:hypothetical protein